MDRASADTLTLIAVVAVVAPLLATLLRGRVPSVVLEIALGIAIGPQVLGLAEVTPIIGAIGAIGLSFLFFMAGFEMDLDRIRGRPLRNASAFPPESAGSTLTRNAPNGATLKVATSLDTIA